MDLQENVSNGVLRFSGYLMYESTPMADVLFSAIESESRVILSPAQGVADKLLFDYKRLVKSMSKVMSPEGKEKFNTVELAARLFFMSLTRLNLVERGAEESVRLLGANTYYGILLLKLTGAEESMHLNPIGFPPDFTFEDAEISCYQEAKSLRASNLELIGLAVLKGRMNWDLSFDDFASFLDVKPY
jgi:hypothetical protein